MAMKACVFVGPSSFGIDKPTAMDRFGPASLGSIYLAVCSGYKRIGLVDGLFGNVPSIWHKEILFALSTGVQIAGSSSMGALRAAEMAPYGMVGCGRIYRYFRSAKLTDDDEVCVLHSTRDLNFQSLSLPMINIRRTLSLLRRRRLLDTRDELAILRHLKLRHFSERTMENLLSFVESVKGKEAALDFAVKFEVNYIDVKVCDYVHLVTYLQSDKEIVYRGPTWDAVKTRKWTPQFETGVADLPPLTEW
jgi:hypothetical protein